MLKVLVGLLCLFANSDLFASELDLAELGRRLQSEGLVGRIHGAVADRELWVFTYRKPNDFFSHYEFPLVPENDSIREKLTGLQRHDQVWIKGELLQNGAPLAHVLVRELEVRGAWGGELPPYSYEAKIPEELLSRSVAPFRVHAVVNGGRALVLEYKDAIVPVFVQRPEQTSAFHRGDKIRMHYVVRSYPGRPTHLSPDPTLAQPFVVERSILEGHGQTATLEGSLVLFQKSPQIIFDVYALQQIDSDGLSLEYTLVNFDSPEVFRQIREKLGNFWNQHASLAVAGRNKLVNRRIKVRATGILNIQDQNQANPQILLSGPDALSLELVP
jgi:hypothetical protein